MDFMTFVTATQNTAFLIAGVLVAALFILELIGTVVGFSLSHIGPDFHVDVHMDANGNGIPDYLEGETSLMGWLNPGGVPFMIFMTLFLTIFAICGFLIQGALSVYHNMLLPGMVAGPVTALLTLILIRPWTEWTAKVLPKDESSDVSLASLVGSIGTITVGPVTHEMMGFIRVRDKFGTDHSIMVSSSGNEAFEVGAEVRLVGPHPTNECAYLIN